MAVLLRCRAVHVAAQVVGFVTMPGGSSVRRENYDMGTKWVTDSHFVNGDRRAQFARPGSGSALRAGARVYPCPTCGCENRLSAADVGRGYQCDSCARRDEGVGF